MHFRSRGTEAIFEGATSAEARRVLPVELHRKAQRKLSFLENAANLRDVGLPPGNRLERLAGRRKGQYSIRISDKYRICFRWDAHEGPQDVEIVDYH